MEKKTMRQMDKQAHDRERKKGRRREERERKTNN
jgi:hypothetical protein